MTEREYVYEVGLTNDDKERLSRYLGVHCLSLNDYGEVSEKVREVFDEST